MCLMHSQASMHEAARSLQMGEKTALHVSWMEGAVARLRIA